MGLAAEGEQLLLASLYQDVLLKSSCGFWSVDVVPNPVFGDAFFLCAELCISWRTLTGLVDGVLAEVDRSSEFGRPFSRVFGRVKDSTPTADAPNNGLMRLVGIVDALNPMFRSCSRRTCGVGTSKGDGDSRMFVVGDATAQGAYEGAASRGDDGRPWGNG